MASIDLSARPRTTLGKKVKQLRRRGIVPANIYGRNQESVAVEAPAVELKRIVRAAGHTGLVVVNLDGEATPRTVVVRGIQRAAMTGELVHVDFQQVSMTVRMSVRVPITLTGTAPVSADGGIIVQALDGLDVECLPGDIPQHIAVDISDMASTDAQIHVRDLVLPVSVTLQTDEALLVASVAAGSAEPEAGAEEAAAVDETAERTEPAAPSEG
jgi:large subunit ribosomal protein L25